MDRARPTRDAPLIRRDAEGRERTAPDWETLTERLIREAQEAGRFDDLPAHGQPLDVPDDSLAGEMALAHHVLHNAGVAPAWIETDKEVRVARASIEALIEQASRSPSMARPRLESELERIADAHDAAVRRLEVMAPPAQPSRWLADRPALRRRLALAFADPRLP